MSNARCNYCSKFVSGVNPSKRCAECEKQFKEVINKITGKYGVALKRLAER